MRAEFARAMLALQEHRRDLVFITVDLGYMALEAIAEAYGERFINAGVAEQNAVSLAAGLAKEGFLPWVYSMASFMALRPFAQIRDNLCLHRLPVKLVGNGGGYGYGIMGATHHALEDVAAMRALPNMRTYVPLVAADLERVIAAMAADPNPNYLRLNASAQLATDVPVFAPWRKLKPGRSCVVIGMGPVLDGLYELESTELLEELEIWAVGLFPLDELPIDLIESISRKRRVVVIEEHYRPGGLAEALSYVFLTSGVVPERLTSLHAAGYPSGRYGSQRWHQTENGLRGPSLASHLVNFLRD
jgi:transketolase